MQPFTRKTIVALGLIAGSLSTLPAHAYYFGYSPYGNVGSLFYPLRAVLGPARALGYGYGYNPLYLGNSVLNTAGYGLMRARPTMTAGDYVDEEPVNAPRQRVKPARPAIEPTDQISHAQWQHPKQDPIGSGWATGYAPQFQKAPAVMTGAYNASDAHQMARLSQLTGLPAPQMVAPSGPVAAPGVIPQSVTPVAAPMVAPAVAIGGAPAPEGETQTVHPSGNAPFAEGFVNLVNQKFNGDIRRALSDSEAKGWARCLGIMDDKTNPVKTLTGQRIGLIQHILGEESVPAATRVEMIKPLLKN